MSDPVNQMEELELDTGLLSEVVWIKDAKGERKRYTVNELPTPELEAFMEENKSLVDMEVKDGKLVVKGIKSYKGMHSILVKRCVKDEEGKLVDPKVLASWPPRVQQELNKIASRLNGLDKKSEEEAGNSQTGTEPG